MALSSFRPARSWLHDPLQMNDARPGRSITVLAAMIVIAAACGVGTVVIGDAMADRPIFYLALPLVIVFALLLVTVPRQLLIGLVVIRAICDPIFQNAQLPGIGGLGGLLNLVVILLSVLLFVTERGWERKVSWLPWVPFLVVMALELVRAPDKLFAVRNWLSLVTYASVYQGAFHCIRKPGDLDRMLRLVLLSAIPVCLYSVGSYLLFGPAYVLEAGEAFSGRLSAPLGHPNIVGFYCVVMLAAWLMKDRATPGRPLTARSIAWTLYAGMILGVLAGTQTRSAWVGALVLVLVYGLFINRGYLVVIVAAAFLAMLLPDVRERVLDLTRDNQVYTYSRLNSYAWRQYLWQSALSTMSPLSYIAGNGYGYFWTNSISFFPLAGGVNWNAHNVYVQLLLDAGVLGAGAYLALHVMTIDYLRRGVALSRPVRIGGMTLVAAFAVMSYSDNMLDYLVVNWSLWFVVGLMVAAGSTAWSATARSTTRPTRTSMPRTTPRSTPSSMPPSTPAAGASR